MKRVLMLSLLLLSSINLQSLINPNKSKLENRGQEGGNQIYEIYLFDDTPEEKVLGSLLFTVNSTSIKTDPRIVTSEAVKIGNDEYENQRYEIIFKNPKKEGENKDLGSLIITISSPNARAK